MKLFKTAPLLLTLLFAGCASGGPPAQPVGTASPPPSPTPLPPVVEEDFEPAPAPPTLWMADESGWRLAAGGEDAAYCLVDGEQFTAHLVKLDYASGIQTYWPDGLQSTFDENDPGWIGDIYGGARPVAFGQNLYVFKYGKIPLENANLEGSPARLHRLAGGGRSTVEAEPDCPFESVGGIATDGQELYLLACKFDEEGERQEYRVCRTDFETGGLQTLAAMDAAEGDYRLVGVWAEGLMLRHSAAGARSGSVKERQHQLMLFSLVDGSLRPAGFAWNEDETTCVFGSGCVYYLPKAQGRLFRFDVATGASDEGVALHREGDDEPVAATLFGEDYGSHLMGYTSINEGSRMVSIETATGLVKEVELGFEYDMGWMPMTIAAETDTQFLVNSSMRQTSASVSMANGSPHTVYLPVRSWALIDKEDYWNSRPALKTFIEEVPVL